MRDAFPPRDIACAQDPKVNYERIDELERLARATFPEAGTVVGRMYDGCPVVEVYTNGRASVLTREQVLASREIRRLAEQGAVVAEHLASWNAVVEVMV